MVSWDHIFLGVWYRVCRCSSEISKETLMEDYLGHPGSHWRREVDPRWVRDPVRHTYPLTASQALGARQLSCQVVIWKRGLTPIGCIPENTWGESAEEIHPSAAYHTVDFRTSC
jgi:hypothetical protein